MYAYFYRITYCNLALSFVHYDLDIPVILNTALIVTFLPIQISAVLLPYILFSSVPV
jgi:hypothetical protein